MRIDDLVDDLIQIYALAKLPIPESRAIALRLLEETVELCLACGASPADVSASIHDALKNEHEKHPEVGFNDSVVANQSEIIGELADTALLQRFTQRLSATFDDELLTAADGKIKRLTKAQRNGTLRWTADGRFYRNKSATSTVEDAPAHPGRSAEVFPMTQNKGKYQGQDVQIVRPAKQGDQGFDAAKGDQVVIKGSDGKEKTVSKSEVQSGESA
jgi:hypothetical protein